MSAQKEVVTPVTSGRRAQQTADEVGEGGVGRGRLSADALTAVTLPLPAAVAHDAEQVKHGAGGEEGGELMKRCEDAKRKREKEEQE